VSKERELLEETLVVLEMVHMGECDLYFAIEELLAQPEQSNEPVAWMYDWKTPSEEVQHVFTSKNHLTTDLRYVSNEVENVRPLYLAPPKQHNIGE
jgi:hypothetical protein